jgi:hypothetical protein
VAGTISGRTAAPASAAAEPVEAQASRCLPTFIVNVIYTVIAFVMLLPSSPATWSTSIPDESGDNLLNLWILRWGSGHFVDWYALWNSPIFWPNHNTFAYSESMLPVALVYGALAHVLGAALTFNLIYVAAGAGSMLATYVLAKRLTGSASGAFIAGLIYALAAPRIAQYGHFQLSFGFLIPVVLLCTLRFFDTRSTGRALALGGVAALLCLSASYYALMTAITVAIIVAGLAFTIEREHRSEVFRRLGLGAGLALLVVAPVALQYNSLHHEAGFHREPNPWLSARPSDFVRVAEGNRVVGNIPPFSNVSGHDSATVENRLFPGIVALGLGAVGVAALVRRRNDETRRSLETMFLSFSCVSALVLVVLTFGNQARIGGSQHALPFHLLERVPGFDEIRAPARFIAFPLLILAVLAALGCGAILERIRTARARGVLIGACIAVLLLESATAIRMEKVPTSSSPEAAVNHAIAKLPAGPVAELPVISEGDGGLLWATVETKRMWLAGIDGHPRVNGFSGFQPPGFDGLADAVDGPMGDAARLAQLGARYVVLHVSASTDDETAWRSGAFTQQHAKAIVNALPGTASVVGRYADAWLIDLGPPKSAK